MLLSSASTLLRSTFWMTVSFVWPLELPPKSMPSRSLPA